MWCECGLETDVSLVSLVVEWSRKVLCEDVFLKYCNVYKVIKELPFVKF